MGFLKSIRRFLANSIVSEAHKYLILRLLVERHDTGLYGNDLVRVARGFLHSGSVYSLLSKMEADDLIVEVVVAQTVANALPRTSHYISKKGLRELEDLAANNEPAAKVLDRLVKAMVTT